MKYSLLLIIALISSTCKKEMTTAVGAVVFNTSVHCPESVDSIYAFPEYPGGGGGYYPTEMYSMNDTLWKYPCFNPNNSNEICYIEKIPFSFLNPVSTSRFIKHNLITREKTVLYENVTYGSQPVWCKNNWAYFAGFGKNIVRINMNSGEREMLTQMNLDRWVTVNILTGQLMFSRYFTSTLIKNYQTDALGNIVDSLPYNFRGDWRYGLRVSGKQQGGIAMASADLSTFTLLYEGSTDTYNSVNDLKIHPNNQEIYFSRYYVEGMYKVDKDTKELTVVKEGNNSCWYDNFSISQDGKSIVFEKVTCVLGWDFPNTVYSKSEIWIMDIDGCNERKVVFD